MSESRPLEVYEALEAEYVSMFGELPPPPSAAITQDQIVDAGAATATLKARGFTGDNDVVETLEKLRVTGGAHDVFRNAEQLSAVTRVLLDDWKNYDDETQLVLSRRILDEVFVGSLRPFRDVRLAALYQEIHHRAEKGAKTSALCLSGGGVRSAAFGLGVLQGLAAAGILNKFDYLSTAGGGSYIGSWLSAWIRRHPDGGEGVQAELAIAEVRRRGEAMPAAAAAEPLPIANLRRWINHLRPPFALFSSDSWAAIGVYGRNVVLKLLIVIPILACLAAFPRAVFWLYGVSERGRPYNYLVPAVVFLLAALVWVARERPLRGAKPTQPLWRHAPPDARIMQAFLYPVLITVLAISVGWYRHSEHDADPAEAATIAAVWLAVIPLVIYERRRQRSAQRGTTYVRARATDLLAGTIAAGFTGALLLAIARYVFPSPRAVVHVYVTFAVPILLLLVYIHINVYIAASSSVHPEHDREWWTRLNAWLLVGATTWAALSLVVIYGPVVFYESRLPSGLLGVLSTIVATVLGIRTAVDEEPDVKKIVEAPLTRLVRIVLNFSTPAFVVFTFALISMMTSRVLDAFHARPEANMSGAVAAAEMLPAAAHLKAFPATTGRDLLALALLGAIGYLVSRLAGINTFSTAGLHRNRLTRSFLAAAHPQRRPDPISGFDPDDDISMSELRPEYFTPESFHDRERLLDSIEAGEGKLSEYFRPATMKLVRKRSPAAIVAVCDDLNHILVDRTGKWGFYVARSPQDGQGKPATIELLPDEGDIVATRRKAIDAEFQRWLRPAEQRRPPMQVLNAATSFALEDAPHTDDAGAVPFTITPLHAGSVRLGYRDAREYSTRHGGISLATATAISSAPAAAQEFAMGGLAFFRNLLNALEPQRGWWLGNPGWGGGRSFQRSNPPSLLGPMIHEAFNDINEGSQWLPLTNAGRFDNLGLFEMVLRRCHIIVVSDATRDPDHLFAELGTAIWRTRVELGVPIELQKLNMLPRKSKKQGAYCAVGRIVYSAVDGHGAVDGLLVYLKPVLYDEPALPTDLYSYGAKAPDFPHESIRRGAMADQQFEMYRALGRHCIEQIVTTRKEIGGQKPPAVAGMLEQLPTDWRLESPGEFASLAERHAKRRGRPKAPPHQWHSRRA